MFLTDKPTVQEVAYETYSINCMGMQSPMLFVGTRRALLVDTGCGNCDLRGVVRYLTDLPVTVAITHEHADHTGGIVQFEDVYVPEKERMTIQGYTTDFMQCFLDFFNHLIEEEPGINGCFRQQARVHSWDRIPELIPYGDGYSWDLGGRRVTAYHCPVHSKGHMVLVDDLSRILYAGDSIGDGTGPANNPINPPTYVSLETEIWALKHVKEHMAEFDRIFTGHNGWGGHLGVSTSIDVGVIDRMLEVGEGVLRGELEIYLEKDPGNGDRNYARKGNTTLYFFEKFLYDRDVPEEYR